jgi:hypothetical protein
MSKGIRRTLIGKMKVEKDIELKMTDQIKMEESQNKTIKDGEINSNS